MNIDGVDASIEGIVQCDVPSSWAALKVDSEAPGFSQLNNWGCFVFFFFFPLNVKNIVYRCLQYIIRKTFATQPSGLWKDAAGQLDESAKIAGFLFRKFCHRIARCYW